MKSELGKINRKGLRSLRSVAASTRLCVSVSVLVLLLSTFCLTASAAPWSRQTSGTLGWLHSVYFLNQQTGWAVGSKGALLTTSDGGLTWKIESRPTEDSIQDVYFRNRQDGWLVCEANVYELTTKEAPRTYLMRTADGGKSWEKIDVNGDDLKGNVDTRLTRMVFSRAGHAWVFGEAGTAYKTVDAGKNWKRLQLPTRYLLLGGAFVDNDRGWLVGAGGTILQTADGGETWHASKLPDVTGVRFTAVSFIDNRLGWAVGSGGRVVRTINGGRTWTSQETGVTTDLLDVKFINDLEGWAVGSRGTVIHTFDGGLHWTAEPSSTQHPLERIFIADRDHAWAVGFGGTIISYLK